MERSQQLDAKVVERIAASLERTSLVLSNLRAHWARRKSNLPERAARLHSGKGSPERRVTKRDNHEKE